MLFPRYSTQRMELSFPLTGSQHGEFATSEADPGKIRSPGHICDRDGAVAGACQWGWCWGEAYVCAGSPMGSSAGVSSPSPGSCTQATWDRGGHVPPRPQASTGLNFHLLISISRSPFFLSPDLLHFLFSPITHDAFLEAASRTT